MEKRKQRTGELKRRHKIREAAAPHAAVRRPRHKETGAGEEQRKAREKETKWTVVGHSVAVREKGTRKRRSSSR